MDIEKVSDLYSNQMSVQSVSKIDLHTRDTRNKSQQKNPERSQFATTEILAEKILALERRVDNLERRIR